MEKDEEGSCHILLNVILWILLLISYFLFVFIVDGILGIGFRDQWKSCLLYTSDAADD